MDRLGAVVVATAGLVTLLFLVLLPAPGFGVSRVAYFLLVDVVAWVGVAGAVRHRPALLLGSGVGLFLLGFWQFTIGLFVVPAAVVFLVAGAQLRNRRGQR